MNRGLWFSCFVLILGAANSPLGAQETIWRSASRPADKPVTQAPANGALLDRPVPIARGISPGGDRAPRQFPSAYRNSQPVPYPAEQARPTYPIASVAQPGTVIAASLQAPVAGEAIQQMSGEVVEDGRFGDSFAEDRTVRARPSNFRPAANWKHPYPAEGGLPIEAPPHGNAPHHPMPHQPMPNHPAQHHANPYPANAPGHAPAPVHAPVMGGHEEHHTAAPGPWAEGSHGVTSTSRFYARGEYLLWWLKEGTAPPLATTGDLVGAPPMINPPNIRIPGALDQPDTASLFDSSLTQNPFSGARLTLGILLDDCGDKAIEVGGFILGQRSKDFSISSAQVPGGFIARPFFAANPGPAPDFPREFIEIVATPGVQAGTLTISAPSRFYGLNGDFVCKLCCGCDYVLNGTAGVRYLNLDESLTITENIVFAQRPGTTFTRAVVSDSFATKNEFFGGQVGVNGRWWQGRFDLEGTAKVALGSTHQTVTINGSQSITNVNGQVSNFVGGLLALRSNSGTFTRDRFAFVPEVGLTVGYHVTDRCRFSVGYNFLYWSSVVRPGDQIDRNIDVTQIPNFGTRVPAQPVNPPRPAVLFKDSDFYAHGLTAGIEIKF